MPARTVKRISKLFSDCSPLAIVGDRRGLCRVMVERPEGKRPLGRPRCKLEVILKCNFRKCNRGMVWIDLAQDRERWRALVNAVMNPWVP